MRRGWIALTVLTLVATGCGWTQREFDGGHSNANPYESTITPANVGTLEAHDLPGDGQFTIGNWIVLNTVFGATAYDRRACPHANGDPCTPLWFHPGALVGSDGSTMLFARGGIGSMDLVATDLGRTTRWVAHLGSSDPDSPESFALGGVAFSDGWALFTSSSDFGIPPQQSTLYAFRVAGCGALACPPGWTLMIPTTATNGANNEWAASGGRLFSLEDDGTPVVRDLTDGHRLWTMSRTGSTPRVLGREVFLTRTMSAVTDVYSADGTTNCSGSPKVCTPLRTIAGSTQSVSTKYALGAVGDHLVWSSSRADACVGSPCAPIATTTPTLCPVIPHSTCLPAGDWSVIAGDVGYAVGETAEGEFHLYAFDLTGNRGCSGAPRVCAPLLDLPLGRWGAGVPTVWDGRVYVFSEGRPVAVGLPGSFS